MFKKISHYLSLVKFSHTLFAMPFALVGFFTGQQAAGSEVSWKLLLLVVLCMVFARSAAMAFNRYIDLDFDKRNQRTQVREIPAGLISPRNALAFVIINSLLFVAATWFINPLCFYLSPIALLVVLGYSYTKRFTAWCHLVLGLGLSLAPIGAYLAVTGTFDILPLFYSFVVLSWVSGFDIIYALQDDEFDKSQQLKSIPVIMGRKKALILSSVLHAFTALFIVAAGMYEQFDLWYWAGALIFSGLLFYQHTLVKHNDLSRVNLAFFTTNGIASIVFVCFVIFELYL